MSIFGRTSIFIVEDNSLYSYYLNEILKEEGNYRITTFETAEECIKALDTKPDLVILDYYLNKGMNGMDFFGIVHEKYPKIPVIILSNQENVQMAVDLLEAGVFEYIEKKDKQAMDKLKDAILRIKKPVKKEKPAEHAFSKIKTRSIFIVDDNPAYARSLEAFLRKSFPAIKEVKVFPKGNDATLELDKDPGVVIVDYYLNSEEKNAENGLEIIKQIKNKKPKTNVILLSGQKNINVALQAAKECDCHYVQKDERAFDKVQHYIHELVD
jgi:DNA-binding NtrC family response regulator